MDAEAEIKVQIPLEIYWNIHDELVIKWKDLGGEHENPSLPQIARNLNLPVSTVTKILLELERRGKVELLR